MIRLMSPKYFTGMNLFQFRAINGIICLPTKLFKPKN